MKKAGIFIFIVLLCSTLYSQFNPPQNFYIEHNYIFPCNHYHLYWDTPESGTPELVNYNIYRNWGLIATLPINNLSYLEVDPPMHQGTHCIYYYITALYENPTGESSPTDTICCEFAISTDDGITCSSKSLLSNHPNPFINNTTIDFSVRKASHVTLFLYNLKGEIISKLVNETKPKGEYYITWNGKDTKNNDVSPGIYFCRIETEASTITKKIIKLQ